ncbi:MAG: hypothetical protein R3Y22_02350 [Bacteroidales bacterium]
MNAKRILSLVCLVIALSAMCISAQPGGGGGMGGGQRGGGGMGGPGGGGRPPMDESSAPKDFVESAGLFYIDLAEIVDECKIKDESVVAQITEIVNEYERTYNNITMTHFDKIDSLRTMQENPVSLDPSDLTRSAVKNPMQIVQELKKETIPMHLALTEQIDAVLVTKKEKKRWVSYYEDLCKDKSFSIKPQGGRGGRGGNNNMDSDMDSDFGGGMSGMSGGMGGF